MAAQPSPSFLLPGGFSPQGYLTSPPSTVPSSLFGTELPEDVGMLSEDQKAVLDRYRSRFDNGPKYVDRCRQAMWTDGQPVAAASSSPVHQGAPDTRHWQYPTSQPPQRPQHHSPATVHHYRPPYVSSDVESWFEKTPAPPKSSSSSISIVAAPPIHQKRVHQHEAAQEVLLRELVDKLHACADKVGGFEENILEAQRNIIKWDAERTACLAQWRAIQNDIVAAMADVKEE